MMGNRRSFAPVNEGEELDVKIEAVGEKGDGIAKKDGFVLFVPNTNEGDEVRVKVTKVLRKVGFAEVVGSASGAVPTAAEEEPAPEDTEDFGEEAPAEEEPVADEEPATEEAPAEEEPVADEEPATEEAPAEEEPATEDAPVEEEAPAAETTEEDKEKKEE